VIVVRKFVKVSFNIVNDVTILNKRKKKRQDKSRN